MELPAGHWQGGEHSVEDFTPWDASWSFLLWLWCTWLDLFSCSSFTFTCSSVAVLAWEMLKQHDCETAGESACRTKSMRVSNPTTHLLNNSLHPLPSLIPDKMIVKDTSFNWDVYKMSLSFNNLNVLTFLLSLVTKVIVLIRATVNHLYTVSPVSNWASLVSSSLVSSHARAAEPSWSAEALCVMWWQTSGSSSGY